MEIGTRLTVVSTQGEADIICGLLRANGIRCGARSLNAETFAGGPGDWHEILVPPSELEPARELLAAEPEDD